MEYSSNNGIHIKHNIIHTLPYFIIKYFRIVVHFTVSNTMLPQYMVIPQITNNSNNTHAPKQRINCNIKR